MKRILLSGFFVSLSFLLAAQVPKAFQYQGIARDADGLPLSNRDLSLRISILASNDDTVAAYSECHAVRTNAFGLYILQIGRGEAMKGSMHDVHWEGGQQFIRVAIDPEGGRNFRELGTTQLLSVPYALYADRAGSSKNGSERTGTVSSNAAHVAGDANFLTRFTALNVIGKSRLFDNGTSIGLGTTTPVSSASLHIRRTTSGQYFYLENPDSTGFGSFRMYNNVPGAFATFTKYGSQVAGGYTGIADKYPFANILGYGNNGPFLNAGTGNIGFAITKAGTNKLKIHIDATTERIGLGGNANPAVPVHMNNTASGNDTVKFTNQTTGHALTDGTEIRMNGLNTRLMNMEQGVLVLGTANADRVTVSANGQVGIGTGNPAARLHVADSAVVFTAGGDTSIAAPSANPPVQGNGRRLFWFPQRGAFRAGGVGLGSGSFWDRDSIGLYSVAMGWNTLAKERASFAVGEGSRALGFASVAMGEGAVANGIRSVAMGDGTQANGASSVALGEFTKANASFSTALGANAEANGNFSLAAGLATKANGVGAVSLGNLNEATGTASFSAGELNRAQGAYAAAVGNNLRANGYASFVVGQFNDTLVAPQNVSGPGTPLFVAGNGTGPGNLSNALVVLQNGNVGVGNLIPGAKLEIDGQVKINGGAPGAGKVLTSDASGLATWQTPPAAGGSLLGTANRLVRFSGPNSGVNSQIVDDSNRVGIGLAAPQRKIHIHQQAGGDTLKVTNATTGSASGDGFELQQTAEQLVLMNRENSTLGFGTRDTVRMSIDSAGRVGIGTAPQHPLHVVNNRQPYTAAMSNTFPASIQVVQSVSATNTDTAGFSVGLLTGTNAIAADGIQNVIQGSGNGTQTGTRNFLLNTGNGSHLGVGNNIGGTGNGAQYGVYSTINNTGDGNHFGTRNVLNGVGLGDRYGTVNQFSGAGGNYAFGTFNELLGSNNAEHFAVRNRVSGSGSGTHYGMDNEIGGTGSGVQIGVRNLLFNTGGATQYGIYNEVSGSGLGDRFGLLNDMPHNGPGSQVGMENRFTGSGSGFHTGALSKFSNGNGHHTGYWTEFSGSIGAGNHVGSFNNFFTGGSGIQAGNITWFQGSAGGSGPEYGSYMSTASGGSGHRYGNYNLLAGTATGSQFGVYNEVSNSNDTSHYGVYNVLNGPGNGFHYGVYNNLWTNGTGVSQGIVNFLNALNPANSSTQSGTNNLIFNNGTGNIFGYEATLAGYSTGNQTGLSVTHQFNANGNGQHIGVAGFDLSAGNGPHYGSYFSLAGTGTGDQAGGYITITNTGSGTHYGYRAEFSGTGTGAKYGFSNVFTGTSAGNLRGGYNLIAAAGGGARYGIHNAFQGAGTGAVYGIRNDMDGTGNAIMYGIYNDVSSLAAGTGAKYGIRTFISSAAGGTHYGIYSEAQKAGSYAGYFLGEVAIGGELLPTVNSTSALSGFSLGSTTLRWRDAWVWRGTFNGSDIRLKTNIEDCRYGLKEVMKLRTIRYNWKSEPDQSKEIGLIAQEVKQWIPEVVATAEDSMQTLMMNYGAMIPVLVKAIQEQQVMLEEYKKEQGDLRRQNELLLRRLEALEKR